MGRFPGAAKLRALRGGFQVRVRGVLAGIDVPQVAQDVHGFVVAEDDERPVEHVEQSNERRLATWMRDEVARDADEVRLSGADPLDCATAREVSAGQRSSAFSCSPRPTYFAIAELSRFRLACQ